jgi:hypothetical protein
MSSDDLHAPHEHNLGKAFTDAKAIFDGIGTRERLQLLKAVGALYGHRVIPGMGIGPPLQRGSVSVGVTPKGPAQPKSSKSRESRDLQKKISAVNVEIKKKSSAIGGKPLPPGDPLFEKRNQLFLGYKSSREQGFSEETSEKPQDGKPAMQVSSSSTSKGGA